jgi:Rrf2 family protein
MKISTKGEYGLRALLELAQRFGDGYIQSTEIAAARDIPENYLHQLLITLRKASLIRSRRGPQGGHMLARPPEHISLAEALTALEGPLAVTSCAQGELSSACAFSEQCAIRDVWQHMTQVTEDILAQTNLADLARSEREKRSAAAKRS